MGFGLIDVVQTTIGRHGKMNLIFFGAGASYGSQAGHAVPALGAKLFDDLAKFAPKTWGALGAPWPTRFKADFETAMSDLINAGVFAGYLQWHMAEYFYRFQAAPQNLYRRLIAQLQPKLSKLTLATLNYDTFLFQAINGTGLAVALDAQSKGVRVCLPHGSSALKCQGIVAGHGIAFHGISTGGSVVGFASMQQFLAEAAQNAFPPVMSYYEPNKFTVSCANFITDQRAWFSQLVARATKIVIVGVRIVAADRHIWGPLSGASAPILYVSGPSAVADFTTWSQASGRSSDQALPKYFDAALADIVAFL